MCMMTNVALLEPTHIATENAPNLTQRAHSALGMCLLWEGDRQKRVSYMCAHCDVPGSGSSCLLLKLLLQQLHLSFQLKDAGVLLHNKYHYLHACTCHYARCVCSS